MMTLRHMARGLLGATALAALPAVATAQGNLTVTGSDTMLQLAQAWAGGFMSARPGTSVTVSGGGTGRGIAALINGSSDVANASRVMRGREVDRAKLRGFIPFQNPVARDGLAIIVNPRNPITRISIEQLRGIYSGATRNWSQLGGPQQAIVAVGRDSSSGTFGFFQDAVLGAGRPYRADMISAPSTNSIAQMVAQDLGAIGYVGIAYARAFGDRVKVLPVFEGSGQAVEPTDANVRNGTYPLWRYLYMYTRGRPTGIVRAFIDWVRSDAGQDAVERIGFYRVN